MVVVTLGDIREAARGTAFELARDALPLAAGDRRVILRSKGGHGDEDLVAGPGREARREGEMAIGEDAGAILEGRHTGLRGAHGPLYERPPGGTSGFEIAPGNAEIFGTADERGWTPIRHDG
jgi:hypothetical protein